MKTHSSKAKYYDLGRSDYPKEFFDFLYGEFGIKSTDTIADIGCGTGKVAKNFLERGNKVYAVEYDKEMLEIANSKLQKYPNYIQVFAPAENTAITTGIIDYIVCGNSYAWFNREKAVPEFQRITRTNASILIMYILSRKDEEMKGFLKDISQNHDKYKQAHRQTGLYAPNNTPPFPADKFIERDINFTETHTFSQVLNNSLSMSFAPSEEQDTFKQYCDEVSGVFEKHAVNGIVEIPLRLNYVIGKVADLSF